MAAVEVICPKCGVQWKGNLRPGVSVTIGANGPPSGGTVSALCLTCEKEEAAGPVHRAGDGMGDERKEFVVTARGWGHESVRVVKAWSAEEARRIVEAELGISVRVKAGRP